MIDDLNSQLQDKLTQLAERWQSLVLKEHLIDQKDEALCFIKEQYTKIYKKEEIDLEAANSITRNLPMVSESENL
ncbi:25235_t:CDS:2, partial [Gigaspora rosea]